MIKIKKSMIKNFIKELENGNEPKLSYDEMENRIKNDPHVKSVDPRGSMIKVIGRHTPGGHHDGDGYIPKNHFFSENGSNIITYLPYIDTHKWDKFTNKRKRKVFDEKIHLIEGCVVKPPNKLSFGEEKFQKAVQKDFPLELIIFFKDSNENKYYQKRKRKGGERVTYLIETRYYYKVGVSKNPRNRLRSHWNKVDIKDYIFMPEIYDYTSEKRLKNRFSNFKHPDYNSDERFLKDESISNFMKERKESIIGAVNSLEKNINFEVNKSLNPKASKFFN